MSTTYTDAFTDADGTLLAAHTSAFGVWETAPTWATNDCVIYSNALRLYDVDGTGGGWASRTVTPLTVAAHGFEIYFDATWALDAGVFSTPFTAQYNFLSNDELTGWSLTLYWSDEGGGNEGWAASLYDYGASAYIFDATAIPQWMPTATLGTSFRFGAEFGSNGVVRAFKESHGGGVRTYLSDGQSTPLSGAWDTGDAGAFDVLPVLTAISASTTYIDNLTLVVEAEPADPDTSTVALSPDYSDSGSGKFYIGRATTLTLTARDAAGDPIGSGGETVAVDHAGGTSDLTISAVTDVGDGTYTATLTALTAGTSTAVTVTIGGVTVTTTMPDLTVLTLPGPADRDAKGGALTYQNAADVARWAEARQYALRFGLGAMGRWQRFAVVHGATVGYTTSDINYFALYALQVRGVPVKQRTDTF